ncbi:MAG: efflux RND transporter periplasmic adaptor subunit [bacterium]
MKTSKLVRVLIILPLIVTFITAGCAQKGKESDGVEAAKGEMTQKTGVGKIGKSRDGKQEVRVETAIATIKPITLEKMYVGEITPFFTVDLKSTASGWLRSITVDTGDAVQKNGIIGVIENDDIQAQVEQSQASISVSKAAVSRAEVDLGRIRLQSDRSESLFAKGYISKQVLEQEQASEKLAEASLEAAKGQLDLSEAQLKNIKVKLRDYTVKAPFSGVVAERYVDPGAYVSPANPILRIEDGSKVKAVINVVEDDFARVRKGVIAEIFIDSYPEDKFTGQIVRISPSMNKASRTAAVEILISNRGGNLKSGMTARVNLVLAKKSSALVIPETALRRDVEMGFDYVFVVEKGTVRQRNVKIGIISNGEAEITRGLKPGEAVVNGDVRVSDGMKIDASRGKVGRR